MDHIRQYLLSVLAAAILCAVIIKLTQQQNTVSGIIKLTASLFLTITMLSPILKLQINTFSSWIEDYEVAANSLIADGSQAATEEKITRIIESTEAYVLGKATEHGADVRVKVGITNPETLVPDQITVEGTVSPYVKQLLQNVISKELGIPKEKQVWK